MSSSRRSILKSLALLALLAGCGMQPVYAPGGAAQGLQGRIDVQPVDGRIGYELVATLEQELGRPRGARGDYTLVTSVTTSQEQGGFTATGSVTRYQIVGSAHYEVRRADTGDIVHSGQEQSFTSYDAAGTILSTRTARTDAEVRLARDLAHRIALRIATTAGDWAQ